MAETVQVVVQRYLAAVARDGDIDNDWITHLPPNQRDEARRQGLQLLASQQAQYNYGYPKVG